MHCEVENVPLGGIFPSTILEGAQLGRHVDKTLLWVLTTLFKALLMEGGGGGGGKMPHSLALR